MICDIVLHIALPTELACSEGLGTSFITDMRSVKPDRARGFLRLCFCYHEPSLVLCRFIKRV